MFSKEFLVLEFGYSSIKLLLASMDNNNIKVKRMDLIDTIENSISEGKIIDVDKVTEQISSHLILNNIKAKKTIITITSPFVIMRDVIVQSYKKNVIKSFIELEANDYFPVELSSCVVDYKVLKPELNKFGDQECKIMLVAIPQRIVESYISVVKLLGLRLVSIDVASDSIVRLYTKRKLQSPKSEIAENISTAFIDIGAEMTNVTIATDNIIKYNKIFDFGSAFINDEISALKMLSSNEVEYEKRNLDLFAIYSQVENSELERHIKAKITEFLESITAFFDFHNSRKTGNKVNNIVLVGGGAYLKGIEQVIEDVFSGQVSKGFEFNGVFYDKKITNIEQKELCFYKCLGACVKL